MADTDDPINDPISFATVYYIYNLHDGMYIFITCFLTHVLIDLHLY